jgi:hypothetical protein
MELLQGARSCGEIKGIHQFFQQSRIRLVPVTESISHVALSLIEAHALPQELRVADALMPPPPRKRPCRSPLAMRVTSGQLPAWN